MPATFSASTCISSNNTSPGPFNIYLDSDYTSTPFSSATLTQLTSCPFVIIVPTGTTSLGFKDTLLDFCFETTIQDNNICSNCNLGLSNYSSSTITQLSCGILTGTCLNINDYVINWYGPNNTTTLSFTSGAGSFLTTGMIPHPFLNNNSIPLPEGVYTPVISKIKLSGITFSNTGGTGTVLFSGNCLPSTTILPLSCSNQTNPSKSLPYSAYNHYISYEFLNGDTPTPVNLTYKVSATTQFFAWRFKGSNNPDRITIKFSGSSYGTNILGLDDFVVGSNNNINNFNSTIFPKSASTPNFFTKLTCLTGLTVNNNDNILITITPGTSETVWELYSTCLTNYDCTSCLFTNPYKIIGSTITGITGSCSSRVRFSISGCNNSSYLSSDLYKYYVDVNQTSPFQFPFNEVSPNFITLDEVGSNPIKFNSAEFYNNQNFCNQTNLFNLTSNCATDTNNVRYQKTFVGGVGSKGVLNITGSSTVISTYYNSWNYAKTNYSGSSSSTNVNYYRYFLIKIPSQTSPNNCLENVSSASFSVHPSSTVSTGLTSSGSYYFRLTAETITNNFSSTTTCDLNCLNYSNLYVNSINTNSTGGTYDREFIYTPNTNNFGVYYTNPVYVGFTVDITNQTLSAQTISGRLYTNQWTTNTIPYSGVSNTLIPSFSGTLCNYNTLGGVIISTLNTFYNNYNFYYYFIRTFNLTDFEIWSAPTISYSANTNPNNAILAYRYSGGNVTYSSSTYIIG
jgi:hypothetical protein